MSDKKEVAENIEREKEDLKAEIKAPEEPAPKKRRRRKKGEPDLTPEQEKALDLFNTKVCLTFTKIVDEEVFVKRAGFRPETETVLEAQAEAWSNVANYYFAEFLKAHAPLVSLIVLYGASISVRATELAEKRRKEAKEKKVETPFLYTPPPEKKDPTINTELEVTE